MTTDQRTALAHLVWLCTRKDWMTDLAHLEWQRQAKRSAQELETIYPGLTAHLASAVSASLKTPSEESRSTPASAPEKA